MMVAVGTLAFTAPKENSLLTVQWYVIDTPDENDPLKDLLGESTSDPSQGAECSELTDDIRCAVRVDNPNDLDLEGMTLEQAINQDPQISYDAHTFKPE
ncbi:hypothetical protein [Albibacterium indicum]|uniref:hypothetical protein n=1 Tax=Albibacterium indicum TaxID=2292082 RepID=UPI0013004DD3|nr:hypothetical protein [Pedobacter indicus]